MPRTSSSASNKFHAESVYRKDWFQDLNPASPFTSVETPDNQTVVLKTAFPLGAVFDYLGNTLGFYVMPREAGGAFDPKHDARGSTGWYRDSYKPSVGFSYKRNPGWYLKDRPYLDGWERPIVPEYATLLSQFRAGGIWGNVARQEDVLQTKKDLPQLVLYQTGLRRVAARRVLWLEQQPISRHPCASGDVQADRSPAFRAVVLGRRQVQGGGYQPGPRVRQLPG